MKRKCLTALCCILGLILSDPATAGPDTEITLAEMAGQMIMVGFDGLRLDPEAPTLLAAQAGQIGGVILFSRDVQAEGQRNISSPEQLRALTTQLRGAAPDLLIAIDQEGGQVQRLGPNNGFAAWPSAREMGAGSLERTYATALAMGVELRASGINVNFAPVVDLHHEGSRAIGNYERAFAQDPALVADHAMAFIRGMDENGICSTIKHFPGHGSALDDTHTGFVDASVQWTELELEPYKNLFAQGYRGMVMPAHITLRQYGNLPADLNPTLIQGLLRTKLGWDGVVITDDLQMNAISAHYNLEQAILLAVNAGADILLFSNNPLRDELIAQHAHAALLAMVEKGQISPERIRLSWQRIQNLKADLF